MLTGGTAKNKEINEKGFARVVEFVKSRLKWFAGIAITSFALERWLPLLTLPATLFIWNHRDQKIGLHYRNFRTGELRQYGKSNADELEAFLEGAEAAQSYVVQFKSNFPGAKARQHPEYYYAGLGAGQEADDELIGMVKNNRGNLRKK